MPAAGNPEWLIGQLPQKIGEWRINEGFSVLNE